MGYSLLEAIKQVPRVQVGRLRGQHGREQVSTHMDVLFIIGQSGSGKTTLAKSLESEYGVKQIRSVTTRKRREKETDSDYEFTDYDGFMKLLSEGRLVEYIAYCGQLYGMREPDDSCIVVIEPGGYVQAKRWCITNAVRSATVYLTCSEEERIRRMVRR